MSLVAYETDALRTTWKFAETISRTEFVPKGLRGNTAAILACIMYGRDIGLSPMVSLREIDVIDGKPSMSAALVTARIRERGHKMWWETIDDGQGNVLGVTAHGERADTGDKGDFTFTMAMAQQAELVRPKSPWVKYPQSMCWARAATQLARMLFSDVFLGAVYTPEELGADPAPEDEKVYAGEIVAAGSAEEATPQATPAVSGSAHDTEPASADSAVPTAATGEPLDTPAAPTPSEPDDPMKPAASFHGNTTQRRTLNWLNMLVVDGRSEGLFTTEDVYQWALDADPVNMRDPAYYLDEKGELHWGDLRSFAPVWLCSQLLDRIKLEFSEWFELQRVKAETVKARRAA